MTASSPERLLICRSLAIRLLVLPTFPFKSREVKRFLFDFNPYGGTDSLGMFPLFRKRTTDVMAPRLSVVFRRLVHLGSFSSCYRQSNVTSIPKRPPSSAVEKLPSDFRYISIV